ncbi:MAG: VOC family protein [Candidatus Marinimicrobia bacterium]|nr:VOC family protein [Candidatus Neomarinimicrobiota bacterium]
MEKSLKFYQDLLGFKLIKNNLESGDYIDNFSDLQKVQVTTAKLCDPQGSRVLLELLQYHSHPHEPKSTLRPICDVGYSHFAITVDNLDQLYEKLLRNGIRFNSPPQHSPDGYAKVTFCRDPEGNLIELVEVIGD